MNSPNLVVANFDIGVEAGDEFHFQIEVTESTEGTDQFVFGFNHYTESLGRIPLQNGDNFSIKILNTTENDGPSDTICKAIPVEIKTNTNSDRSRSYEMNYCLDSQSDIFLHHTNWDEWESQFQSASEYLTGEGDLNIIENGEIEFKWHFKQSSQSLSADNGVVTLLGTVTTEEIVNYDKNTGVLNYYRYYQKSVSIDNGDESVIKYEIANSDYTTTLESNDFEFFPFGFITLLVSILFISISANKTYSIKNGFN